MSNFASGYIKYINHIEQINDAAIKAPAQMIKECEGSYHEHLRNIARNITEEHGGVRIAMLSGPSSSGKTTTAHLLKEYLGKFGKKATIISMDNFYRGRELAPIRADGKYDYEAVEALEVEKLKNCIADIVKKGRFEVPNYSFAQGKAIGTTKYEIDEADMVIMEGIHALNPIFTSGIDKDRQIKLYVSVKQQIKDANGEVISPMDLRLIRRIVRDMHERDTTADRTLSMWDSVMDGENNYIRPYRMSADYTVNSIHLYEPCVLRTLAIQILREIPSDNPNYNKARDLESRLMRFEPIETELVPHNSMIREFIGADSNVTRE